MKSPTGSISGRSPGLVRIGIGLLGLALLAPPGWQAVALMALFVIGVGIGLWDWKGVSR